MQNHTKQQAQVSALTVPGLRCNEPWDQGCYQLADTPTKAATFEGTVRILLQRDRVSACFSSWVTAKGFRVKQVLKNHAICLLKARLYFLSLISGEQGLDQCSRRHLAFQLFFNSSRQFQLTTLEGMSFHYPHFKSEPKRVLSPPCRPFVLHGPHLLSPGIMTPPEKCTLTPIPSHYPASIPWPVPVSCTLKGNIP